MVMDAFKDSLPATQLRPFHTRQCLDKSVDVSAKNNGFNDEETLKWKSSHEPRPDKDTAVVAFMELVSLIVVLDAGEAYCIQDSVRDRVLVCRKRLEETQNINGGDVEVLQRAADGNVPTDFSIGAGKVSAVQTQHIVIKQSLMNKKALQLHFDETSRTVELVACANMVPAVALDAIGQMLDSIVRNVQKSQADAVKEWSNLSIINFPPETRPPRLASATAGEPQTSNDVEDQPALLHQWFEQRVIENASGIALDFLKDIETGTRLKYTYAQVENAANSLAAELMKTTSSQAREAQSSTPKTVAVLMGPCPELYISYLAILKAGMAFCPIPVDAPQERKDALIEDLQPCAILVDQPTEPLPSSKPVCQTINVAPHRERCDVQLDKVVSSSHLSESDIAYILYTSGTTGRPKGVAVSHLSASCTISALSSHYNFLSGKPNTSNRPVRWFQGAAPTFDISIFEIFWTLSTGSTLCCAPRDLTLQNISQVVKTLEADITNITPSFASVLDPSSIQGVMLGGEMLNARLLKDFAHYNPRSDEIEEAKPKGIYNGYGPTETAIYCIAQAHVPEGQRGSIIGTPLATCGVLIVEGQKLQLKPVPMGAVGELVITGPQVSQYGYLNRPKETAAAFVDDARYGRAYRTGDRARIVWDEQQQPVVEFLGRMSDDQVKLSGRRVELGEIDGLLASKVKGIQDILSVVWKPNNSMAGSEKIVSLVVPDSTLRDGLETLNAQCVEAAQQHLPDYMRPFKILEIAALPKSASGKTDRKAATLYVKKTLERLSETQTAITEANGSNDNIATLSNPEDAKIEEHIATIISRILGVECSAATLLADVGMDSLFAMRLLHDIRQQWPECASSSENGLSVTLQPSLAQLLQPEASIRSVFFASNSDEDVKRRAAKKKLAEFSERHIPEATSKFGLAGPTEIELVLPTTTTQSQLAMSFAMDSRSYISHSVLKLKYGTSLDDLKLAVESVIAEQAIFRTAVFTCDDGASPFAQVVFTPSTWSKLNVDAPRVSLKTGDTTNAQAWTLSAEKTMTLDSQLYNIQIVESQNNTGDAPKRGNDLLIISMAHCICDGASIEALKEDISRRYAGVESIQRDGLYEAVLEWVTNVNPETDKIWQESMKGWETESFGALSGNNPHLIEDSERIKLDHGKAEHESNLSWQELETRSRALGGSPLSVLQAAWSLLLNIFSEADTGDITFGNVTSGSQVSCHAPTFSVVPCRVPLPPQQSVGQLLNCLAEHSKFAQGCRHTSFGIFETLPYNTALALQAYDWKDLDTETAAQSLPWDEAETPAVKYDFAMFAEVLPQGLDQLASTSTMRNVAYKLSYRADALSKSSATCIVRQLASLTELILKSKPDDLVQALPSRLPKQLLSAEGKIIPQSTQPVDTRTDLLHHQFEKQALSTPDRLALAFYNSLDVPPTEMTYQELNARANGLATILREENVDIIPICMHRSVELYVAILAILKAGSAWCPIDETSPVQRRTSLIARTQSKILLTSRDSLSLVKPCLEQAMLSGVRVLLIDDYAELKLDESPDPREGTVTSDTLCGRDLAYLLWTSGTTGEPKGVMIQHFAASQAMRDLQVQVEHDETVEQVRTLQLSSYSFDVFVQDLFYTWGLAGSVISGTRELVLGTFVDFIWKSRPTHAHLTPSFGASIAVDEIKGSTLQYVTFIGEKLTEDVAESWASPEITTRAYNTYGPAENAVVSTMRRFYGKSRDLAKAANVGFPLNPCTAYVVREVELPGGAGKSWELVPRYGVGELALGGNQVGKGYLNNEVKTTKAFIQGGPGIDERIYLTGDMVRLNDHGFEFLGRNDDLVKITGIRIELSEISAACATIKDQEPIVEHIETFHLPRPGSETDKNNKVVVTFVSVKSSNADLNSIRSKIFQRAKDMLPAYMVPGHIVVLDTSMPRTASNKVDRKALQAIYQGSDLSILAGKDSSKSGDEENTAPGTKWTEIQLSVLKAIVHNFSEPINKLSPEDSLAGLGLSSLQITKMTWTLRKELQCSVGVIDLMRCQTLGELVDAVVCKMPNNDKSDPELNGNAEISAQGETSWVAALKRTLTENLQSEVPSVYIEHILPATPLQESLLVETMREPRAYWAHRIFDLSHLGEVDIERLKKAWNEAMARFDILRIVFVPLAKLSLKGGEQTGNSVTWAREQGVQSTIMQLIRSDLSPNWNMIASNDATAFTTYAEKLQLNLTPSNGEVPPWAVTFCEADRSLMLSMHHALYDGVSSQILLDTVSRLYQGQDAIESANVDQFAHGLELGLLPTHDDRIEALSVWESRLSVVREAAGSLNAPFPDLTQSRQKQPQKIILSRKQMPSVIHSSGTQYPSQPTLLKSAFGCVLASYLELKAVMFGQTVSQRILHQDLAKVVGPAIATLPVVVNTAMFSARDLWKDMTEESSRLTRAAHNLHPVDIKKLLNYGTENSQASFPALFVYHPAPEDPVDANESSFANIFRETGQALSLNVEHPLALNVFEDDSTIELTGDARFVSQDQLDLMLEQILEQARVMLEGPDTGLDTLTNNMRRDMVSISGTETIATTSANPTDKLSKHAKMTPDRIAVEEIAFQNSEDDEDDIISRTITYAQLDNLADKIAAKLALHDSHLKPDDVVAMYLARDIKSLATTLAIFRSGFIYLPIDEDLPLARKQLIIRDSNAKLIITTDDLLAELDLNLESDAPSLLLPDDNDDIEKMLRWPTAPIQHGVGQGGYLLYTSGSTGRPKGVRVSNSNLCHFVAAFSARLTEACPASAHLGDGGKYLNLTSRAFDPHITQIFVPWYMGHRVVIGKDRSAMIGNLQQIINSLGISHFGSVPSVLSQMGLRPEDVPSVKVVTTGGEKASNELLDMWSSSSEEDDQKTSQAVLFNFYGPTEVTIGCLGHPVNNNSNSRNLGKPLHGLEAILVCPGREGEHIIARKGQPGELCIAGPQVAIGYFERPVENAKSFVNMRISGEEKRIYKTGDMMRMMHDGTLEFLGRADQQAKIRGQRLELDEIVSFLKQASTKEGQLDFAATVVSNGSGHLSQQQLVGFVARKSAALLATERNSEVELIRNPGHAIKVLLERLEQECQKGLPAFMVPTLIWASRIPHLVASGKVDTKVLGQLAKEYLEFDPSGLGASNTIIEPALNDKELAVVAAVEEATGAKVNASRQSSLQSLGVDSLSAINIVSSLRAKGLTTINLAGIMSPTATVATIAALADVVLTKGVPDEPHGEADIISMKSAKLSVSDLGPVSGAFKDNKVAAVLPCLPLQAALIARSLVWLSNYNDNSNAEESGNIPYVTQFRYNLAAGTDMTRWKQAAESVVASEAMFKTCFVQREDDGEIFQVVLESVEISPFEDSIDSTQIISQMNTRPPIRVTIGETNSSGETLITLRVHHALFDGAAMDVLRGKLEKAYNDQLPTEASAEGSFNLLRALSTHCCLSDKEMQSTKLAWKDRLRNIQPCLINSPGNGSTNDSMARSSLSLQYTASQLKDRLREQSGRTTPLSSAAQLAMTVCLAKLTNQTSIAYGFVFSLRTLLGSVVNGADNFVGPCLNTLVESIRLRNGTESLSNLAQRVKESHTAVSSGFMPLISSEKVQRWTTSEDRLFNALLSINVLSEKSDDSEAYPGRLEAAAHESKSDVALAIDVDIHSDDSINLTLSSSGALKETQLAEVGQLFQKVVWSAADPNARLEDFVRLDYTETSVAPVQSTIERNPTVADEAEGDDYQSALAIVENHICRLLRLSQAEVSKMPKTTSLYQLGLDSITILPFLKLVNKSEAIKLNADAVIKSRTIQGVADLVRAAKAQVGTFAHKQTVSNAPTTNGAICETAYGESLGNLAQEFMFLATPLQESMLSASLAVSEQAYTYVHSMQLSARAIAADTASFEHLYAAFQDTVRKCEILRTSFIFTQDDEKPWLGLVSETEQSDRVSFVVRGKVVQLKIHHALYDARSIKVVWKILQERYQARLQGQKYDHETAVYLFRPFAKAVALAQKVAIPFWSQLLYSYDYQPAHFVENHLQASAAFKFQIGEDGLSQLQERCKTQGVSLKASLQLAWSRVLCESVYGQNDVVYGEVVSTGGGFDIDGNETMVGPSINTLPMRTKMGEDGSIFSISEALARVQNMNDEIRGGNSMASLRKVQTMWRSSQRQAASLFESLFVFDGVTGAEQENGLGEALLNPVQDAVNSDRKADAPAYDDYPIIVSFYVRANVLYGKLRAKADAPVVKTLGTQLESSVKSIIITDLDKPIIDKALMETTHDKVAIGADKQSPSTDGVSGGVVEVSLADAVLEETKSVLGKRCVGKVVTHDTKLVNIGLDSISAIRLSKALRKRLGINVSVFEIIKGSSINEILRSAKKNSKPVALQLPREPVTNSALEQPGLVQEVATKLQVPETHIESVVPVLAGQRSTLEQWLRNGKRFFEAPWVYQIDASVNLASLKSAWFELCRTHDVLRTTFVWANATQKLVQVTFSSRFSVGERFVVIQDSSSTIQSLVYRYVAESNARPSNLTKPPSSLTYLEARDGNAVVLRIHHALYDGWSIKMIEGDLMNLLSKSDVQSRQSLNTVVQKIQSSREHEAETLYWNDFLSGSQNTVIGILPVDTEKTTSREKSAFGAHFKEKHSSIVNSGTIAVLRSLSNTGLSSAIIVAYAKTLGVFGNCSRPVFGFNHASRSLSAANGAGDVDLMDASIPTLTATPLTVDLKRTGNVSLNAVKDHLAQLNKYSQADGLDKICPAMYNSYLNVIFRQAIAREEAEQISPARVLTRQRLGEPLASDYFTKSEPSQGTMSTIEGIDTSHLCPHRLFFNVVVDEEQDISVSISGDELLFGDNTAGFGEFVQRFAYELEHVAKEMTENPSA